MTGAADEPFTLCPWCEQKVDPDASGVHYAVQLIDAPAMGGQMHDFIEGLGGFFHPACDVPRGWRVKPKP